MTRLRAHLTLAALIAMSIGAEQPAHAVAQVGLGVAGNLVLDEWVDVVGEHASIMLDAQLYYEAGGFTLVGTTYDGGSTHLLWAEGTLSAAGLTKTGTGKLQLQITAVEVDGVSVDGLKGVDNAPTSLTGTSVERVADGFLLEVMNAAKATITINPHAGVGFFPDVVMVSGGYTDIFNFMNYVDDLAARNPGVIDMPALVALRSADLISFISRQGDFVGLIVHGAATPDGVDMIVIAGEWDDGTPMLAHGKVASELVDTEYIPDLVIAVGGERITNGQLAAKGTTLDGAASDFARIALVHGMTNRLTEDLGTAPLRGGFPKIEGVVLPAVGSSTTTLLNRNDGGHWLALTIARTSTTNARLRLHADGFVSALEFEMFGTLTIPEPTKFEVQGPTIPQPFAITVDGLRAGPDDDLNIRARTLDDAVTKFVRVGALGYRGSWVE